MAVTIKDVAKLAGVSPSTVSRVCNDNPAISKETRERVQKAMSQLGYDSPAVNDTQTNTSVKMIGIILPPSQVDVYDNTFYLKTIRGISRFCNQQQVATNVVTGKDYEEILQSIQTLHRSGMADGFILLYSFKDDIVVDYLCEHGLLYVIVGKANELANQTISIDNDNLLAGREVTDYLYDLGHRRIGYLGGKDEALYAFDRKSGYQLSLLQHGLQVKPEYCFEIESIQNDNLGTLQELLLQED